MTKKSAYFIDPHDAPQLLQMAGLETKILSGLHGEKMMMVLNSTLPGHTVPLHSHPHEQIGIVYAGEARLRIGEEERVVRKGDFYCIPGNVEHSDTTIGDEPFVMLDIFYPVREDFIAKHGTQAEGTRLENAPSQTDVLQPEMKSFPEPIARHPAAAIPLDGVRSHLIQAGQQQFVYMQFDRDVDVPEHSHEAQWGVVLEGEIHLTISGVTRIFTKGDTYFIEKGCLHSATIKKGFTDLTLFDQRDRYSILANDRNIEGKAY